MGDSLREIKSGGREHPETPFPHSKLDRAGPDQFAIDLDWDLILGGNTQTLGLKILQFWHADGGAEDHLLQITNNLEIADSLKYDDIEQAVVDEGAFKERERSTIKAAISDEDKGAFHGFRAFRLNHKMRRRAGGDLCCRNKVAERAEAAFERQAGLLHRLGVESDAGELHKMFSVRVWQINGAGVSITNNLPALLQVARGQTEFRGKDINGADRQQTERGRCPGETINHFIDRSVAAGRNNSPVPFPRRFAGERFRFANA